VLVGELTGLVSGLIAAGPAVSFDEIERRVGEQGRELLRKIAQHVMDELAAGEQRLAAVADAARGAAAAGRAGSRQDRGDAVRVRGGPPAGVPGAGAAEPASP
jgi:hypothetical protein